MHKDCGFALRARRQSAGKIAGDEGVKAFRRVGEKNFLSGLDPRKGGFQCARRGLRAHIGALFQEIGSFSAWNAAILRNKGVS